MSEYAVMIHPQADVHHTAHLGHGSQVWAWSTLLEGVQLGEDCMIATGVEIGHHVRIGRGCRIQHGTAICDQALIGNYVFIGSNVSIADCRYPKLLDKASERHEPPVIGDEVVIGCNAVICPGVEIGRGAQIGAGAVVTRNVPAYWVVTGVPARRLQPARLLTSTRVALNEAGDLLEVLR